MKKLTLLAVLLLAVCVAGFADDQLTFTVDGSATATFGIDLETQDMGFDNAGVPTLAITLIAEQDFEKGGTEGAYGYIKFDNLKLVYDQTNVFTLTVPTITAKIIAAPLWIGLWTEPAFTTADKVTLVDGNVALDPNDIVGGLSIGYDSAALDLTAKVASEDDWLTTTAGDGWTVGLDATVTAAPVTLAVGSAMSFGYATNYTAFGVKPSFELDVSGDMDLKPYVAFDGLIPEGGDMEWQFGAGATFELTADDKATIALTTSYSDVAELDAKLAISEAAGAGGFHPALGATASLLLKDLTATLGYTVSVGANWTTEKIYPYFVIDYSDTSVLGINVGTKLYLIPNTTFQIDYDTDNLDAAMGVVKLSATIDF